MRSLVLTCLHLDVPEVVFKPSCCLL